ncbi:MAG: GspE/PulE family protein, partial [Candidatus Bipolaricaulia bacterium]
MMPRFGDRLGDILIDIGSLSETELNEALAIQETEEAERRLGEILVKEGFIAEEDLGQALYQQTGYAYIRLADQEIDDDALALVDEGFARRKIVMPIQKIGNRLLVAIGDPNDVTIIDELSFQTGLEIEPRVSTPSEVKQAIETAYSQMRLRDAGAQEGRLPPPLTQVTDDMPVSRIVEAIINEAWQRKASDIHIEPLPDQLRVRYRIDGVLHEVTRFSMDIHDELVALVRDMANLDISEKGTPQDSGITLGEYELRVSIFSFIYGEKIVLQVLNPPITLAIEELRLQGETLHQYQQLIHNLSGLILVTGPTGSGKTTTLAASLKAISSPKINIATIEDPPKYRIDENVNQAPVNSKKKIDFAHALQ